MLFCVSSIFLFQYLHLQLSALTLLLSMQHNRINKYIEIFNIRLSPKTTPQPIISLHVTAASLCCLKHFPGSQYHTMATKIFSSIREKNISVIWILITFLHVKTQVHTTTKCWNRHYSSNFKLILVCASFLSHLSIKLLEFMKYFLYNIIIFIDNSTVKIFKKILKCYKIRCIH